MAFREQDVGNPRGGAHGLVQAGDILCRDMRPFVDVDERCPCCRGPMRMRETYGSTRIVRVLNAAATRALVSDIPDGYRLFICVPCRLIFTSPPADDPDVARPTPDTLSASSRG